MDHRLNLSGVFAPVVTPFVNDEVRLDDLRHNLRKLGESGLRGYLALGSNGEFKSLSEREELRVLEVFAEEKGSKTVMVGTGCESTAQTIEKSRQAAELGFDYVSIITPHYFAKRMDGPALHDYYERLADSLSLPVLLYNVPGFAGGVQIPPATVSRLSRHENIVGMKDSSPTGPGKFLDVLDPDESFFVLAGSANFFYPALHLGAAGSVISLANALPDPCCQLHDLFVSGHYEKAAQLHHKLSRLNSAISGTFGVAGVKGAMDLCGFRGGEPRHPLKAVTDTDKDKIRSTIAEEGF